MIAVKTFDRREDIQSSRRHSIVAKTFDRREDIGDDYTQTFVREIEGLIRLSHPCVVAIVGYSLATQESPVQIGIRYAANGSLREVLDMSPPFLDDTGKTVVVCGIIVGMRFIHSQGFVHGDLKPENILLDERGFAQIGTSGAADSVTRG
jgi:serine/threonine protein kinase